MPIVEIPVGPQHPALKEPIRFIFQLDGEIVVGAEPRLGYAHRGIEKLAEHRTYVQALYLSERICGICSVAHTTCYVETAERVFNVEAPPRAKYIRVIVSELNRIHSHLLWLGILAHEVGFDTLFMYTWRDREMVLDLLEMITGNRVLYAINMIGGVRHDITPEMADKARKVMDYLEERTKYYKRVAEEDPVFNNRLAEVGILSPSDARRLCAVGPTIRGSGVKTDIRRDDPYSAYDEVPFNVITYDEGDALAKTLVRIDEILESINMIRYALDHMPGGEISVRVPMRPPPGEAVGRVEAPRGELFYYIKSDGTMRPYRFKVRTPTLANIPALCRMLEGIFVADIPVVVASIDPCIACMDRVLLIDKSRGKKWVWTKEELRRYSLKWYEEHGRR
ncbi:MAG: nickel-dependent hydrogenase large subunit [Thermoprotei archaeon]|nr:nickel-dependent hydrogenase large subunit [Thermoprotei archaeon]